MSAAKFESRDQVLRYLYKRRNWARWPSTSQLGTLNLATATNRTRAAASVSDGRVVSLSRLLTVQRSARNPSPVSLTDRLITPAPDMQGLAERVSIDYHGYTATHLDALSHVWGQDGGWCGANPERNQVAHRHQRWGHIGQWSMGVVTRGVLIDIPSLRGQPCIDETSPVTDEDLEAGCVVQGVAVSPGDALVIHMGRVEWEQLNSGWNGYTGVRPGLDASCLRFFREHDLSAVVWDFSDARPNRYSMYWTVHLAIPYFGLAVVDNADSEELAVACRSRGRYEFLLAIAPLRLEGGTGSPVNPLAIF